MADATDLIGLGMHPVLANKVSQSAVYADDDISSADAPSLAELVTAFGAAATKQAGWLGIVDDGGAGSNSVLVWSDGTNYFYVAGTKAS